MTHSLTAKEQSLAKIFSDDYVFTIPGYQRPYSWGKEQAQELLDDLLGALSLTTSDISKAAPYFLGSIVLIKAENSPEATVVDGQQRLTTLTLLLSAVRAVVENPDVQAGITKRIYEHGDVVSNTQARYRLSLRDRDRDFFRQHVQHEKSLINLLEHNSPLPDAQARLKANAQIFVERLSQLSQPELVKLVQFIITRCYLVTVATPDLDSAYRIFGVMNSRGMDLSATDILKAEAIGGIDPSLREIYTNKWEEEEENLGRHAFGELFSHIRMVYRKAKPQGTLLKEFKDHVTLFSDPQTFIDSVLLPMALAFSQINGADYVSNKHAEQVNKHLHWLNRLEFKDWVPPSLVYLAKYREEPDMIKSFFSDMERLAFSMLVRKVGVNDRIERFSSLTKSIEQNADLTDIKSPLQLTLPEQYDTYSMLNGALYDTHAPRALALLLLRLDHLLSDGSASYQYDVVSVEHVMPQQPAPNSQWSQWVPDKSIYQGWVHRLGNLALLSRRKNSSASNRDFTWKKTTYFTRGGVSSFALTTQVLQHSEWSTTVMQKRQNDMLQAFEIHWKLQDRKSKTELAEARLHELGLSSLTYFELESAKHGLSAVAFENGTVFTVQEGSQAKLDWTGQPHSYMTLREELLQKGLLIMSDDKSHFLFTKDIDFNSPSAASATVLGRTDNGRNSWRIQGTSISYAAWQENLPKDQKVTGQNENA